MLFNWAWTWGYETSGSDVITEPVYFKFNITDFLLTKDGDKIRVTA